MLGAIGICAAEATDGFWAIASFWAGWPLKAIWLM